MPQSSNANTLIVGTRGSQLARAQTGWVIDCLKKAHPHLDVRMEIITTTGDRQQGRPLPEIGGKGLFTAELEQALHARFIDIAVHSAKDLPTDLADGLEILAWPVREDPRDAWISAAGLPFEQLPTNSVVGTGSLRRQAQLLMRRPDLTFVSLRGNVDTRLKKIERGDAAGAVLALAGLKRVGLTERVTHPFDMKIMLPAPGQGALAIEGRIDDERVAQWLTAIHDEDTALTVRTERIVLAALDAGCRAPLAVYTRIEDGMLVCDALASDPKGERSVTARSTAGRQESAALAAAVTAQLRAAGADEIIAACR